MAFQQINPHKWDASENARLNGIGALAGLGEIVDLEPVDVEGIPTDDPAASLSGRWGGLGQEGAAKPWWQDLISWGTGTARDILVPRFSLPPGTYESTDSQGNRVVLRQSDGQPVAFSAGQYAVGGQAGITGGTGYGISTGMIIAIGLGVVALVMVTGRRK